MNTVKLTLTELLAIAERCNQAEDINAAKVIMFEILATKGESGLTAARKNIASAIAPK